MPRIIIDREKMEKCVGVINAKNTLLLEKLHNIQNLINSLQGEWEGAAAAAIRGKITGMEPRFQDYHDVVDNYAKLLHNIGEEADLKDKTYARNAEQFI